MSILQFSKSSRTSQPLSREGKYKLSKITTEIETRLVNIKRDLFQIGRLLSEAKGILPHGSFQEWIETTFEHELPYSTAAAYMAVHERFQDSPKLIQYLPVHFLMKMSQESFPDEIREIIKEHESILNKDDVKAIDDAYARYKKKNIGLAEFMSLSAKQVDLAIKIEKGHTERRIAINTRRTLEFGMKDLIHAIKNYRKRAYDLGNLYPEVEGHDSKGILIKQIDDAIKQLQNMKSDIEGGKGLFRPVVRANPLFGKQYIPNL